MPKRNEPAPELREPSRQLRKRSVNVNYEEKPIQPLLKKKAPKRKRAQKASASPEIAVPVPPSDDVGPICRFPGKPVEDAVARTRWPHHYVNKKTENEEKPKGRKSKTKQSNDSDDPNLVEARCHYTQAVVDDELYSLNDDAHVETGEGTEPHICRIIEIFETVDGAKYFTAQWYYRDTDTVMNAQPEFIHQKCIFFSDLKDDNPLELLARKLHILRLPPKVDFDVTHSSNVECDYYCTMKYELPYTSFVSLADEENRASSSSGASSAITSDVSTTRDSKMDEMRGEHKSEELELSVLDVFSGCGGMSHGLCMGAKLSGLKLVTRWAVDIDSSACKSFKLNHEKTTVRNEAAGDFLALLVEYEKLCSSFGLTSSVSQSKHVSLNEEVDNTGVSEVEELVDILYGIPPNCKDRGLYFKVRWKDYNSGRDLWTHVDKLKNCSKLVEEFVREIHRMKKLPLPGDVDLICGGPPCQGISGFNRFRDVANPLADTKNKQLIVFMDIIKFLKPRYILMENVVDIIKLAKGYLGRYAIARLVGMSYQARLGIMAAGAYGVPQFRLRVFLWGCLPDEILPPYPLPTYNVIPRGGHPVAFERNLVGHEEGHGIKLNDALVLKDVLSDLPQVGNKEERDAIPYLKPPQTEFQRWIRSTNVDGDVLDHQPLPLNADDYARVQLIPKKKGANYRDLPGVLVDANNKAYRDPRVTKWLHPNKLLVPDYAITFMKGCSLKPFGRLWWDETVSTVVTRAEPHNQIILHPEQDRVLTVRENARLQGFPDSYRFDGSVKKRYVQVGNAVPVVVSTALGFSLAKTVLGCVKSSESLLLLPPKFPDLNE